MESLTPESGVFALNKCILCQKSLSEQTSVLGLKGWERLQTCNKLRRDLLDTANAAISDRLTMIETFEVDKYIYHKSCYEKYTNKEKLKRLQNPTKRKMLDVSGRTLRSGVGTAFNKDICIVCQIHKDTKNLRNASTYNINNRLEKVASFDYTLRRRLAYAFDAMAGDVRYHTYCLNHKERDLEKLEKDDSDANVSFRQLCFELHTVAAKGQVVTIDAVFQRYLVLAQDVGEEVPQSYVSRRSTFREKIENQFSGLFQFYRPLGRDVNERGTLLISHNYQQKMRAEKVDELYEGEAIIPTYQPRSDSGFNELVHVALKLRSDLKSAAVQKPSGINISEDEAESMIPDSLFLFLNLILGGKDALENVENIEEGSNVKPSNSRILSVAQDLVYLSSKGKKLTPKHIGLGLTLHKLTGSKELVCLFNKAGHCASYEQVLQLKTAMGQVSLASMDPITGCVVPVNLERAEDVLTPESPMTSIVHVTADNVDILMDTLDGKRSFHGTQMVVFQRGIKSMDDTLRSVVRSKEKCLKIPEAVGTIVATSVVAGTTEPVFKKTVNAKYYTIDELPVGVQEAETLDVGFLIHRKHAPSRNDWTEFNKSLTDKDPSVCGTGYMPLILQPAHELSTLNTVLARCLYLADQLKHYFITLTVDQQLYCKLLELLWANENFKARIILRMGGLHIALNFLKAIGQHMSCCGLSHAWIESGIISEKSAAKVAEGKAYGKGMRIHKLTLQALWEIMEPLFYKFLSERYPTALEELNATASDTSQILSATRRHNVIDLFSQFVTEQNNVNMLYWWSYMRMVLTLLQFTRSLRDGIWDLYKASLTEMLPWMARYDHMNYFKSLSVYIAELNQLPSVVEDAYRRGEFVVKRSPGKFNQVDPDHAQEWTVSDAKATSGGIVGIIQKDSALQRWALTFSWGGDICNKTKALLGVKYKAMAPSALNHARRRRNMEDEESLKNVLIEFDVCDLKHPNELRNIATKEVATKLVQDSLLSAKAEGHKQVLKFVEERLGSEKSVSFHAKVTLNRPLTFESLYKSSVQTQAIANKRKVKEDRNILQRVIIAFEAGRAVNLPDILTHELFEVPLSLALPDGSLRSGKKSDLLEHLMKDVPIPGELNPDKENSHLIIDAQALIQAIGAKSKAKTFKDFSCEFVGSLKSMGKHYSRVDVVFDRYDRVSTKSGTRSKRAKGTRPIRKNIDSGNVPFPQNWSNFMALSENKAELALFLSKEVITHHFSQFEVVVAGGFQDGIEVASTCSETQLEILKSTQEEADTRIVLHAICSTYKNVVVSARDTDVFVLLLRHFKAMKCENCWMMMGTKKSRQFSPIHEVHRGLPPLLTQNIPAFLAVIGCDTTSHLSGIGIVKAFKVYKEHADLLSGIGICPISEDSLKRAEEFVVRLYGVTKVTTTDEARYLLFSKVKKPEDLPPTSDALRQHLLRAHYQSRVWLSACDPKPSSPDPTDFGWRLEEEQLKPVFFTKDTVPKACMALISCGCKKGCRTKQCKCRRAVDSDGQHLTCAIFCRCQGDCSNGINNEEASDSESSDDDPDDF